MFEKEAEEYVPNINWHDFSSKDLREEMMLCYRKGAEFGYNKALEKWKKCFLTCSSPFCSKHFPTVESSGVLGNMEKKEK